MAVRQNLIKLCEKLADGEYLINENSPEYKVFEQWITDDQIEVLYSMDFMKLNTTKQIADRVDMPYEKVDSILKELDEIGLFTSVHKPGFDGYVLPVYAPGVFEFMLLNDDFCSKHPEVPRAFEQHAIKSQEPGIANHPMGVGIMRVIPVESAIPNEVEVSDMERLSKHLEATDIFCAVPCQCRRVRRYMNEGTGDLEEGMCLYLGTSAQMCINKGIGQQLTREEAFALLKKLNDMGCVHQITTLSNKVGSTICNCMPDSCLALGATRYYNTPNNSRSNFVAEIDIEKCVACGQCVEQCPNNAVKLGQKLCAQVPLNIHMAEDPEDTEWGPDKWNPDYRNNRENVVESGTAPCKTYCPAHIAVQGYIRLAAEGKYREALELIKKKNPFPAVCGRICPHDCEKECTRGSFDEAIAIDEVKKFIADKELEEEHRFIPQKLYDYGKPIAIIGSGPAGLSCAYYLAADGYKVTVFEKEAVPGGMMTLGIPAFRLEKEVVNVEIDVLREMGVQFKCGIEVGKDVTLNELRDQGFEAFYIAIGAQAGRKLGIEGEDTPEVISGVDFLKAVNLGKNVALNGNVIVIGGGNVAIDVARTAARVGAGNTYMYCLESLQEMPALPEEIEEAQDEGIRIFNGWGPKRILVEDGKVKGVEFKKCISVFDDEKRFSPQYDEERTITVDADHVLVSVGQSIEWGGLLDGSKVECGRGNTAIADPLTYQTAEPDVFVGGDVYSGPKFAIDAIAAGKEAAISIHRYVWEGQSLTIGRNRNIYKALDKDNLDKDVIRNGFDDTRRQRVIHDRAKRKTFRDDRLTFTEEQVKKEAARCLACGATIVDQNRCIGCGVCTTRCKFDAIHLVKKFDADIINYFQRKKPMEEYAKQRAHKIEIKKAAL